MIVVYLKDTGKKDFNPFAPALTSNLGYRLTAVAYVKVLLISQLRCQFRTCDTKNRTCEVQAAAAFSKRSCDFKTHLRFQKRICDLHYAGAILITWRVKCSLMALLVNHTRVPHLPNPPFPILGLGLIWRQICDVAAMGLNPCKQVGALAGRTCGPALEKDSTLNSSSNRNGPAYIDINWGPEQVGQNHSQCPQVSVILRLLQYISSYNMPLAVFCSLDVHVTHICWVHCTRGPYECIFPCIMARNLLV